MSNARRRPNIFVRAVILFRDEGIGAVLHTLKYYLMLPFRKRTYARTRLGRVLTDRKEKREIDQVIDAIDPQSGIRSTAALPLDHLKQSDTLFILGSGASIEALTPEQWQHIERCDSIGFNFWLIHDHVPTYYMFEAAPVYAQERDDVMRRLMVQRKDDYRDVVFINNHRHWLHLGKTLADYPDLIRSRLYLHAPFYFPVFRAWQMRRCFDYWMRTGRGVRNLVHHGATLSSAILFGIVAGYQQIVTLGIDLNHSDYFWEANPEKYAHRDSPPNIQLGGVHQTADKERSNAASCMPIDEYLAVLDQKVMRPLGVRFQVGNANSRLAERFPLYDGFDMGQD